MSDLAATLESTVEQLVAQQLAGHTCACNCSTRRATAPPRTGYTIAEAAASIGISTRFTYELVERGELAAVHLGSRVIVPAAVLEKFLDAQLARTA